MAPFSKKDKILIKSLYELGSLQQSLQIKVGQRTASTGCWWSWGSWNL